MRNSKIECGGCVGAIDVILHKYVKKWNSVCRHGGAIWWCCVEWRGRSNFGTFCPWIRALVDKCLSRQAPICG